MKINLNSNINKPATQGQEYVAFSRQKVQLLSKTPECMSLRALQSRKLFECVEIHLCQLSPVLTSASAVDHNKTSTFSGQSQPVNLLSQQR